MYAGADFNNVLLTIEVPAKTTNFTVSGINIVDDNINERKEFFVLAARILGQAADVACFQNGLCKCDGYGGTQLIIRDNDDGKY